MVCIAQYDENQNVIGFQIDNKFFPLDYEVELKTLGYNIEYKTDNDILKLIKDAKIIKLNISCGEEIISGFNSSALGSEHKYQSELEDQTNLIGLVAAGTDDVFKAGNLDVDGNVTSWEYKLHTATQLKQVLADGATHKQTALAKYYTLKAEVEACTTEAQVEAIVW
jgi:hypothetical protein